MSLFRKIRRRHKAFILKGSAQKYGDTAASVFPVDDGEDGDEDEDADSKGDSLQQTDEQICNTSVSAGHGTHQMPFCMERLPVQTDESAQSSIISTANPGRGVGQGEQIVGKDSRFWSRIAKIAAFVLVTVGAFFAGKLITMAITLTLALAFKLFGKGRVNSGERYISAKTEQSRQSHELLPRSTEMRGSDGEGMVMIGSRDPLANESNGTMIPSYLVNDAGDSLLAQRKKLKRLDCIKIPPSASPFVETMEDSPSSSAKTSPRTWFRNTKNSTPTGKGTVASSAEMDNQGKFKSKVLLRHLRKKGEPQSAPSSPLSSSQEGSSNLWIASDGSDTERSAHPMARVHRRSKFRPASPAKEANASMGLPDQQTWQTFAARKGKRTSFPMASMASEATVTDVHNATVQNEMETPASMPARGDFVMSEGHISAPSQAVETLRNVTMKADIHSPLSSTHERGESPRRSVTLVSQGLPTKAVTYMNLDSVTVQERGKTRRKQGSVGPSWVVAGFMIMLAGLFMGRLIAVVGLVCYWYSLSLKRRKSSERRS